jgi:hypothetical protein
MRKFTLRARDHQSLTTLLSAAVFAVKGLWKSSQQENKPMKWILIAISLGAFMELGATKVEIKAQTDSHPEPPMNLSTPTQSVERDSPEKSSQVASSSVPLRLSLGIAAGRFRDLTSGTPVTTMGGVITDRWNSWGGKIYADFRSGPLGLELNANLLLPGASMAAAFPLGLQIKAYPFYSTELYGGGEWLSTRGSQFFVGYAWHRRIGLEIGIINLKGVQGEGHASGVYDKQG